MMEQGITDMKNTDSSSLNYEEKNRLLFFRQERILDMIFGGAGSYFADNLVTLNNEKRGK